MRRLTATALASRLFPSESNCSVAICADSDDELIEAAIQHAVAVHGHQDTAEFRMEIAGAIREGTPPLQAKAMA